MFDSDSDDDARITVQLTKAQYAGLKKLTDARAVKLFTLIDLIGDMHGDGVEFLRRLGDDDHKSMTAFLARTKPKALTFLTDLSDENVSSLIGAIKIANFNPTLLKLLGEMTDDGVGLLRSSLRGALALQWTGWAFKWLVLGSIAMFVALSQGYKEVLSWLK